MAAKLLLGIGNRCGFKLLGTMTAFGACTPCTQFSIQSLRAAQAHESLYRAGKKGRLKKLKRFTNAFACAKRLYSKILYDRRPSLREAQALRRVPARWRATPARLPRRGRGYVQKKNRTTYRRAPCGPKAPIYVFSIRRQKKTCKSLTL